MVPVVVVLPSRAARSCPRYGGPDDEISLPSGDETLIQGAILEEKGRPILNVRTLTTSSRLLD